MALGLSKTAQFIPRVLSFKAVSEAMTSVAHETHSFTEMMEEIPYTTRNISSTFAYTELAVKLGDSEDISKAEIKRKLEEIYQPWQGQVKTFLLLRQQDKA